MRATSAAVLAIASFWAQSQIKQGKANENELKNQMMWIIESPAVQAAIRDIYEPLDPESKRDVENFVRGAEAQINIFSHARLVKLKRSSTQKLSKVAKN